MVKISSGRTVISHLPLVAEASVDSILYLHYKPAVCRRALWPANTGTPYKFSAPEQFEFSENT
jgi:hypothetical protein